MSQSTVLELARLGKTYRAGILGCVATVEVLRDVTLTVRAGDLITIDGARAAGKTTLLLCAAGMLRPDVGTVVWPALVPRPGRPPAGIAYAANRAPAYGFLTVREAVAYAATVRELHEPGAACESDPLLDLCGLRETADTRIAVVSPAERARIMLAFALVAAPRLLLIDDLDGGPDAVGRAAIGRCLVRVAATGVGVVWAARALGGVGDANGAFTLADGTLQAAPTAVWGRPHPRVSLELDVPAAAKAAAALAPRVGALERRGAFLRVPLDDASAEEVLALCRDLAIPVRGSRVVREP